MELEIATVVTERNFEVLLVCSKFNAVTVSTTGHYAQNCHLLHCMSINFYFLLAKFFSKLSVLGVFDGGKLLTKL
jgi:hypothetical protein